MKKYTTILIIAAILSVITVHSIVFAEKASEAKQTLETQVNTATEISSKACLVSGQPLLFLAAQNAVYKDCSKAKTCLNICQCYYDNCADSCKDTDIKCVNTCIKDWNVCKEGC